LAGQEATGLWYLAASAEELPGAGRRRIAGELRRLREAAGLTHEHVAAELGWHRSKIGRIEGGAFVRLSLTDLRALLDLYGVTDTAERDALIAMAKQARERGWWYSYSDVLPNPHSTFIGLEAEATSIRTYQAQLVPALLQTEDYTRAVLQATRMTTRDTEETRRFLEARKARQELLTREPAAKLWVVLDEGVLRRRVGGPAVMRAQLERLQEASDLPHVTIQILADEAGEHAGLEGSFTIMAFVKQTDPDVVYLDAATGGIYLEKREDRERYTGVFDHVRASALSPKASLSLIERIAQALPNLKE
jgi:transcriptional regulator with XRE-family HTH domain